jgi:hypothetical protein
MGASGASQTRGLCSLYKPPVLGGQGAQFHVPHLAQSFFFAYFSISHLFLFQGF